LLQQVAFWLLWAKILAQNSYFGFSFSRCAASKASSEAEGERVRKHAGAPLLNFFPLFGFK
jgi:hypothetical protein